MLDPSLKAGQIISNRQLMDIFHCACEGGIRYSSRTDSIVLVVNNTKPGRSNIWENGILYFAGRPVKSGSGLQGANLRLASFLRSNVGIFLFEVNEPGKYVFMGRAESAGEMRLEQTQSGVIYPVFPLKLAVPVITKA